MSHTINLCKMNDDCLLCIFNYLTIKEIQSGLVVCKQYNAVANHGIVWRQLFNTQFDQITVRDNHKSKYRQFNCLDKFLVKVMRRKVNEIYKLHTLSLSSDKLPPEIGLLINLQTFFLDYSRLQSLPSDIGLLTNLQKLSLHVNQLQSFPSEICLLVNLQELYLSYNQLQSLPPEIGSLVNLQRLNLHNNQLQSLPSEIGFLINLQRLLLHGNPLQSLPSEIGLLINLRILYLNDSQVNLVPDNIKHAIQKV